MKKETFVKFIEAIESQIERGDKLSLNIQKAYLDAGEEKDFRNDFAYEPATTIFMNDLVNVLSEEMSNEKFTVENAKENIEWYLYDILTRKSIFEIGVDMDKYAYIELEDGTKMYCRNAGELYDILKYLGE